MGEPIDSEKHKRTVWEFTRTDGWKEVSSSLLDPTEDEELTDYMKRHGYVHRSDWDSDFQPFTLQVWQHEGDAAEYAYFVFVGDLDGRTGIPVLIPDFPDLLALGREVYPLWRMAHDLFIEKERLDRQARRAANREHDTSGPGWDSTDAET